MVSDELWRTVLGSDPNVTARTIQLGAARTAVVGVLPAGFRFPTLPKTDVVVTQPLPDAAPSPRKSGWLYGMGRLKPGVTLEAAGAELSTISQQMEPEHPDEDRRALDDAQSARATR